MISKNMYKVLKNIPHAPKRIQFKDLDSKKIMDISLLKNLLREAKSCKYIQYCDSANPYNKIEVNPFYLTEEGQVEIEEYKDKCGSSAKATCAIVISALSFIASVVAIIVSSCSVQ